MQIQEYDKSTFSHRDRRNDSAENPRGFINFEQCPGRR